MAAQRLFKRARREGSGEERQDGMPTENIENGREFHSEDFEDWLVVSEVRTAEEQVKLDYTNTSSMAIPCMVAIIIIIILL